MATVVRQRTVTRCLCFLCCVALGYGTYVLLTELLILKDRAHDALDQIAAISSEVSETMKKIPGEIERVVSVRRGIPASGLSETTAAATATSSAAAASAASTQQVS